MLSAEQALRHSNRDIVIDSVKDDPVMLVPWAPNTHWVAWPVTVNITPANAFEMKYRT